MAFLGLGEQELPGQISWRVGMGRILFPRKFESSVSGAQHLF